MIYSRVVSTGSYLPERVMTNAELESMVDTSDEPGANVTPLVVRSLCSASA